MLNAGAIPRLRMRHAPFVVKGGGGGGGGGVGGEVGGGGGGWWVLVGGWMGKGLCFGYVGWGVEVYGRGGLEGVGCVDRGGVGWSNGGLVRVMKGGVWLDGGRWVLFWGFGLKLGGGGGVFKFWRLLGVILLGVGMVWVLVCLIEVRVLVGCFGLEEKG